jgi:two-component system sensor kinase FixL
MNLLSKVTIAWSMIGAGVLTLGLVHGARWALDRRAHADLAFSVLAISFAWVALSELNMLFAPSAEAWGQWVRWMHPALFGLVVGTAVFVHLHLGTGRRWLLWSIIAIRAAILVINYWTYPNFNFAEINSVLRIPFMGESVTVVGEAVTGRLQFLGALSSALLVIFVFDASVTLWRRGGAANQRRAAVVGGSILVSVVLAVAYTQLVVWQLARLPILITPCFLVALLAMSFDLSSEMLHASRLAGLVREGQSRLEMAATAANLGLWEWSARTRQLWATRQARELFGLGDSESRDYRRWLERVHPDDSERLAREIGSALEAGEEYTTEFRIDLPGADVRWIMIRGRAERIGDDAHAHVRGLVRDISESKRARAEAHELRLELAHADRVTMLGQLSSSLAHELSQPLGAILRNAEAAGMMLQAGSPDIEELKAIVTDIQRDDRRARDVIDRHRAMLRRREAETQPVATDSLVQDVISLVRADAVTRGVTLEQVPSPDPPAVIGDRVQLSQVLLNLILNAMDAVAGQPPERRRVTVAIEPTPDAQIEIRVTDSGPGIPLDLADRLFKPFFTTKAAGLGMGLAISRTIVEEHGGSLSVDNNGQAGATFRLRLPIPQEGAA